MCTGIYCLEMYPIFLSGKSKVFIQIISFKMFYLQPFFGGEKMLTH